MTTEKTNKQIDKAIAALLKECDGEIKPEDAESIKVKTDVLKAAMLWEKIKHNIREKEGEGSEWGAPSEQ